MDFILVIATIAFVVWVVADVIRKGNAAEDSTPPRPNTKKRQAPPPYRPKTSPRPAPQPNWTQPEVIAGKCYVIDGDTIVINKVHIRLFGIDAPELNHPWGKKAKWEMVNLCKGRVITATLDGSSSHNRVVATCRLPDGTDLNEEMVKRGLAIDWPKFSGGHYAQFEVEGIRKKLWRCHYRQLGKFFEVER
ncbi:thermonuclease family protein [Yoonia sp. R2331]|uniref:thermonuclease family protein n=1 Tax=Yoonia sp. R2331 TaxID=3237238 RepID=UPI0034E41C33